MSITASKGFRLSLQQARLWAIPGDKQVYRCQCAISIAGPLRADIYLRACEQAVKRHAILRSVFYRAPGMEVPLQVIVDDARFISVESDLTDLAAQSQGARIEELFQQLRDEPFDLANGPLLRLSLLRLEAQHYLLLISLPALCADAATLQLFVAELNNIYTANVQGAMLTDEPLQYIDVSAWQDDLLREKDVEAHQMPWHSFALEQLAEQRLPFEYDGGPGCFDQEVGQDASFVPAQQEIVAEHVLCTQLDALIRHQQVSQEALLLACWQVLLWRLTGEERRIVGVACQGRTYEELANSLGLYTRFVPLALSFEEERPFIQVLHEAGEALEAIREEQYFFTWNETLSSSETKGARNWPFFPVSFAYDDWPEQIGSGDLSYRLQRFYGYQEPFGLHLHALQVGDHLSLHLHYDTARLHTAQVQRIATLFSTLLRSVLQQPLEPVGRLALLPDQMRQALQEQFAPPSVAYPSQPWHRLVEAQVAATPDQIAVVCGEHCLSYWQVNERANALAWQLRERGVGPDVVVGLCLERSVDLLVGELAVFKAGGAYLPLEPTWPDDRLSYVLHETQAPVLLTHSQVKKSLTFYTGVVLDLTLLDFRGTSGSEGIGNLPEQAGLEDLAYVIYTSGSTGRPKGVAIRQSSLLNYIHAISHLLNIQKRLQWAYVSSIAADLGHTVLFPSFLSGGCLHLVPYEVLVSGEDLARYSREQGVDVLKIVPTHFSALLASCPEALQCHLLPREALILGGEVLHWGLIDQLRSLNGCCRVFNHYGPTETTVGALVYELEPFHSQTELSLRSETATVPIGCPLANCEAWIVDRYGQVVPPGVTGDLLLAGAGLATGYLHQPEQTSQHFLAHPFAGGSARAYRTGDRARYTTDGQIEYVGRADSQIKLRGYRIEPGEIETVLDQHPGIAESVVLAREDTPGNRQLVAYVVMKRKVPFAENELRAHVQAKLPDYMVPSAFVWLQTLPLTSNGKVDRKALPAPGSLEEVAESSLIALRSPVEELIAECWKDVLGVKDVGAHENFFERGGHSLLATQLISRVYASTQIELSLRTFFELPTVAGLARQVEVALLGSQARVAPPLVPVPRHSSFPLSFAQQRLWFLDLLDPGSSAYNKPMAVRLNGQLQAEAFGRSLAEIVRRHEILRTTFQMHEGQPVQIIKEPDVFYLPYGDLSALSLEEREAEMRRLVREEANHPFDLAQGPLLRLFLLRLGPDEQVLLLNMHHIISDGWSNSVFVNELVALYTAFVAAQPSPLQPLPIQYADFAVWQQRWLQGEVLEAHLAYWKAQLGNVVSLDLPTDRPRPPIQTFHGTHQASVLPLALSQDLKRVSQREKVTVFMLLLAAFQVLLARYCGNQEIVVGTPIANRNRSEIEGLIGFFVNTLALHTSLAGNPTFREVLGRVRETALGAYAHQDLPFEKLVEVLQPERDLSRSPLFQVMFVFQNLPMPAQELPGLQVAPLESEGTTAKFDLTLTMMESEDGLVSALEYNTDLFDHATMSRLLEHWQVLLTAIVDDIEQPVAHIPLLTPREHEQIVVAWNDTQGASPESPSLHQLFDAQVALAPDKVALVFEEEYVTYGTLDRRANQLAHYLSRQGVGPETLVGLYMERSNEMIVALLGILKAGGVYVPLDPASPTERLAFMMDDASLAFLLTQERLRGTLPERKLRLTLLLDTDWPSIAQEDGGKVSAESNASHLAYVVYTSGSTGKPKGVAIGQRSVVNYTIALCARLTNQGEQHFATVSTLAADLGNTVIFCSLVSGGCLHILSYETVTSGQRLARYATEHPLDVLKIVPSHLSSLLSALPANERDALLPHATLILGGEAFSTMLARQLQALRGSCAIWNHYGPTETTIGVLVNEQTCREEQLAGEYRQLTLPMGCPLAGTQAYVLDRHLQPVPVGIVGELHIGGVGLARGYLNRPELTAEKFIPHPFSLEPGARLYRTGDLVRYKPDGMIGYIGRMDDQVKVRGFRVELGEIEAALTRYPGLQACAVLSEEAGGDKRLVAYVTEGENSPVSSSALRDYLKTCLPDYMLPSRFVVLETLPLTANGKIDRQALAALAQAQSAQTYSRARNNLEFQLQSIWEEILDQRPLGIADNFFELGGYSILAVRLMTRIRQQLGQDLALSVLFQHPTIAELAVRLRQQQREPERWPALAAIRATGTKTPFFCVHPAGGTVFHYYALARRLDPDQPFYGLQTPDLDGRGTTYRTVPEMAAHYIAALQSVQTCGPYMLGGWSLGGVIAFEMANQLRRQGHEVAFLALIDSSVPHATGETTGELDASDAVLARYLIERNNLVIADDSFSTSDPQDQLASILAQGKAAGMISEDTDLVQFRRFERMQFINVQAARAYVPEIYPGRITLFRASDSQHASREETDATWQDLSRGWDKLTTQEIDVHVVRGTHATMIDEPDVESLAGTLRQCMAQTYPV